MARTKQKKPKRTHKLPPPLPPGKRTIGQLVAETIRFYGRHFWRSLLLGIGPACVTVAGYFTGFHVALAGVVVAWIVLASASYVGACVLVTGVRPPNDILLRAFLVSCLLSIPFMAGLLWLAPLGLAVPAIVVERIPSASRSSARSISPGRTTSTRSARSRPSSSSSS